MIQLFKTVMTNNRIAIEVLIDKQTFRERRINCKKIIALYSEYKNSTQSKQAKEKQ